MKILVKSLIAIILIVTQVSNLKSQTNHLEGNQLDDLQMSDLRTFDDVGQIHLLSHYPKTKSIMADYNKYKRRRNLSIVVTTILGVSAGAMLIKGYTNDKGDFSSLGEIAIGAGLTFTAAIPLAFSITYHRKGIKARKKAVEIYNQQYENQLNKDHTSINLGVSNRGIGLLYSF